MPRALPPGAWVGRRSWSVPIFVALGPFVRSRRPRLPGGRSIDLPTQGAYGLCHRFGSQPVVLVFRVSRHLP